MNHLQHVIRNLRTLRLLKLGHAEKYHLHILSQESRRSSLVLLCTFGYGLQGSLNDSGVVWNTVLT